ncbi:MAG: hypothetical protein KC478_15905 [Bacteriovoracaceae bacterium]|nr:hypothetical protein [Bacteriovoracaceae bacterium]
MQTVATWEFSDNDTASDVKTKINHECGMSSSQVYSNRVEIHDECGDMAKAADICAANGGKQV